MQIARRWLFNTPLNCALTALLLLVSACGGPTAPQPPAAASGVTAEPGPGYITVSWTDNSDSETGFQIFREATGAVTSQQAGSKVGEVGAGEASFVDLDIEPDQEYEYSVVAFNEVGSSEAAAAPAGATVPIGVDLMVGTNNRRLSEDSNGTIFAVYFVFPEAMIEDKTDVFEIDITGPPGWNEGSIVHYECGWDQCDRPSGFVIGSHNEITAIAGDYAVTVAAAGQTYTATETLADPDFKFPRPTDITVTNASSSGATVKWTAPAGTKSHFVTLYTGRYDEYVDSWVLDETSSLSVDELALDDGFYGFEIVPFNADISTYPLKVEPFGLSYLYREFGVGEIYSPECTSADQAITVPDAALHQALADVLQIPSGDITCIDMARLTAIDAEDAGIANLEGLQYALNLGDVYLHGNDVTDISPLAGLTKMWHLNLNLNEVTDVSPLANLTELTGLHLCCTTGDITDVTPLEGLTKLEGLNLTSHHLGDELLWPLLENYPNLRGLWVGTNDLTDFGQLANHPQLEVLEIGGHVIDDLSPVAALENLRELQIYWSEIADLTPLYDMTYLSALDISGLELTDITFLEDFVDLERLYLGDNLVTSLTPLVTNTGISDGDYVDVRNNQLDLEDPDVQADIQTLLARGVDLDYE